MTGDAPPRTCSVPGCDRPTRGRVCSAHYARLRRLGDVLADRPIAAHDWSTRIENQPDDDERFWSRVDRSGGPDACWPWTARAVKRGGYGDFQLRGRRYRASRYAYQLTHGPIPPGLVICHRCDNPPCVNPAHLYSGTQSDNERDKHRRRGQVLVELAIAFPILVLLLLATVGVGLYIVAMEAQQGATQTIADWAASNTTGDAIAYAATLTDCPASVSVRVDGTTVATVVCDAWTHALVPFVPAHITTTATGYR